MKSNNYDLQIYDKNLNNIIKRFRKIKHNSKYSVLAKLK